MPIPADFNMTVGIEADTKKLDAGLKKMEARVKGTVNQTEKMGTGLGKSTDRVIKLVAHAAAVEAGLKAATMVTNIFKGDMEAALESAKQLPLGIGAVVSAAENFMFAITGAKEELEEMERLFAEQQKFSKYVNAVASVRDSAESTSETLRVQLATQQVQGELAREQAKVEEAMAIKRIQAEKKLNDLLNKGGKMHHIAVKAVEEQLQLEQEILHVAAEQVRLERAKAEQETVQAIRKQTELLQQQLEILKEEDAFKRELLTLDIDSENKIREMQEKQEKIRERIVELQKVGTAASMKERNALVNQLHQMDQQLKVMIAINEEKKRQAEAREADRLAEEEKKRHEEELKRIEELEKAEKERLDAIHARHKKMHDLNMEMIELRADAEAAVAGATSTFNTAGGTFVTKAKATVDESKIMRNLSQQSRDFLEQIVTNTARFALGGFA